MMCRAAACLAGIALFAGGCAPEPQQATTSAVVSDAEIKAILSERVNFHEGVGMVVGVVGPGERRIVAYGTMDKTGGRPVDGDTIFDLASTTKGFTGLLLAEMAARGEVKLNDPVANYLPPEIRIPVQADGRTITLLDLATFYSSLPRDPPNLAPEDPRNPFADYSMAQFEAFMAGFEPPYEIGSRFAYSNTGYYLLGQALSRRAGLSYDQLVKQRILDPLGMNDTGVINGQSPAKLAAWQARGYDKMLAPAPRVDHPDGFMAAGALSSSANDLVVFLEAMIGLRETPLAPAFAKLLQVRRPTDRADMLVGLGWGITERDGKTTVWKTGGHAGFSNWIGYDPATRAGVVVLSNSSSADTTDIGFHLLNPDYPLKRLKREVAGSRP